MTMLFSLVQTAQEGGKSKVFPLQHELLGLPLENGLQKLLEQDGAGTGVGGRTSG